MNQISLGTFFHTELTWIPANVIMSSVICSLGGASTLCKAQWFHPLAMSGSYHSSYGEMSVSKWVTVTWGNCPCSERTASSYQWGHPCRGLVSPKKRVPLQWAVTQQCWWLLSPWVMNQSVHVEQVLFPSKFSWKCLESQNWSVDQFLGKW